VKKQISTNISVVILLLAMVACNASAVTTPPPSRITPSEAAIPSNNAKPTKEKITFKSGDLTLEGFIFKPAGDGPFPAIVWNHGSEPNPDHGQFDAVASVFVPAGYVLFAPVRRGQGESQGESIVDRITQEHSSKGDQAADQLLVNLMETEQLQDQLAGLTYLKALSYVDQTRIGVSGCSYGGIQTILGAESSADYKAAMAISPAAESWKGNQLLRERLIQAVDNIHIPVFLIHPAQDASLEPGKVLGAEFERLGKPYQLKIFPPIGTDAQQSHCFGSVSVHGQDIWGPDALEFFNKILQP
jgi:dienelactone hydrolase